MEIAARILIGVIVVAMTIWGAGMLYFSLLVPEPWRALAAGAYAVLTILAFFFLPRRGRTALGALAVFGNLVFLFLRIPASNERDWQPEVAVTPYATVHGEMITIYNVRNFDYRTETDFTPHWERRTYNLRELDSADLNAVYWAGKAIAHIMVSFGFGGKDFVTVSIETRKEKGEGYSTLAGFFRQYELYYVVADERDVIRLRTTYRQAQEDVYVYRVNTPIKNIRQVFLDYIKTINKLHVRPAYYNTLTTNCTTSVLFHTRMNPESPPLSWKILLSGYVPDYLYELGRVDTTRPFPELEKMSHVNGCAQAADRDPAFSQRIREGLPKPAARP